MTSIGCGERSGEDAALIAIATGTHKGHEYVIPSSPDRGVLPTYPDRARAAPPSQNGCINSPGVNRSTATRVVCLLVGEASAAA